jgi:hypothetical protein
LKEFRKIKTENEKELEKGLKGRGDQTSPGLDLAHGPASP